MANVCGGGSTSALPLTLTATGQHKDRIYHFQAPPITLTINAPESDEKKDEPKLAHKQ